MADVLHYLIAAAALVGVVVVGCAVVLGVSMLWMTFIDWYDFGPTKLKRRVGFAGGFGMVALPLIALAVFATERMIYG